jgi:hypothetical protein
MEKPYLIFKTGLGFSLFCIVLILNLCIAAFCKLDSINLIYFLPLIVVSFLLCFLIEKKLCLCEKLKEKHERGINQK